MENSIEIVVSLTTIPDRINKMKEVILSIINQSVTISKFYIIIPEDIDNIYIIPPSLYELIPKVEIIRSKNDFGPITKLLPIIDLIDISKDIWLLTIDDDIIYDNKHIYNLINEVKNHNNNKDKVYGFIGLTIENINNNYKNKYNFSSTNCEDEVSILEGYGSIIYHRSVFKNDFKIYIKSLLKIIECKYSDDILISNYLAINGIKRIQLYTNKYNKNINIEIRKQLNYTNDLISLENGKNGVIQVKTKRYSKVLDILKKKKINYLIA